MNIIIAGVGGQGILLAGKIIAETAMVSGFDVKQSEVHGMAQRGGSVVSHVRFGKQIFSPTITPGEADLLIGFEPVEALRNAHLLSDGGNLVCNTRRISTMTISAGAEEYPADAEGELKMRASRALLLDGSEIAASTGDIRALNLVLLGAAMEFLPFSALQMEKAIKKSFSGKIANINIQSFRAGISACR